MNSVTWPPYGHPCGPSGEGRRLCLGIDVDREQRWAKDWLPWEPMSTRKLILTSLLLGVVILVAFAVQLIQAR